MSNLYFLDSSGKICNIFSQARTSSSWIYSLLKIAILNTSSCPETSFLNFKVHETFA